MKTIYLITNNPGKLLAAKSAFQDTNIELKQLKSNFPEIQADTSLEIARYTAVNVAKEKNIPVIREDHSLFINELSKFPGPYTSYYDENIPAEKLLKLIRKNYTGYFEISLAYAEPKGLIKTFTYQVPIKISKGLKGNRGNWNKILMLKDSNKTIAESTEEENTHVWNKNFKKLAEYLKK